MSPRKRMAPSILPGPFPFTYDEFEDWYAGLTNSLLEPARLTFTRILNETLDQELSDVDRLRIRVSHSRIKSPSRLWNKMLGERYVSQVSKLDDVPLAIDDLVGVRVTCNNLIDVENFRNIIVSLSPVDATELPAGLCIDPETERRHSKNSGYRAYHINLHTLIPARSEWKPARGELQVRTLLQDSWGELTHEDTYKPGSDMPLLVTQFAKRMADLLATVDDLAQDLRNELDQLAQQDVSSGESPEPLRGATEHEVGAREVDGSLTENIKEALLAETRRVVHALTKPAPLAQVASQIQGNFGRDATKDWGGFVTFKELLKAAAPEVQIIDVPPGTVVPATLARAATLSDNPEGTAAVGEPPEGVPALVHRLKQRDSGVPAITSDRLSVVLDAIVSALKPKTWDELGLQAGVIGTRELNQLSKYARNLGIDEETAPSRATLDYTLKSLYFSQNLRPGLDKAAISKIIADWFFARASRLGLVLEPINDRDELDAWFAEAL